MPQIQSVLKLLSPPKALFARPLLAFSGKPATAAGYCELLDGKSNPSLGFG
jgi:hypothetical protein